MSANYRFIASEAANYPVVALCRTLGVSRSGYYGWASRPKSSDDLAPRVSAVFWRHSRRYGSSRIAAELQAESKAEALQGGGWAYLATWLDLYSRKIVGWQVARQ